MIVGVFVRRPTFEIIGVVVPAIFVDVMNVQFRPEVVYFAVGVGGETVEVEIAVMPSSGIPDSKARVVIEVELYPWAEYHARHPPVSGSTMGFGGQRRGPQGKLVTTEIRVSGEI